MTTTTSELALLNGPKSVTADADAINACFHWPIVTDEDKDAVTAVLEAGSMSGNDITKKFEEEFAAWVGRDYALAYPNGTESLRAAMWALGVSAGDEVICPSMTYWASAMPAFSLGASVHFADIDPNTLCIDPGDIEHRIGPRTKAIVVVHYAGHPCDMDAIMPIAQKHGVKVIEDVSHAHGALYKGRLVGSMGDVGAMSMMGGKSFAIGEGGMLVTDDNLVYQRCIAYGFYERGGARTAWGAQERIISDPELQTYTGVPMGGYKHRLNQTCSAMGRVQLKHYPERIAEIQSGMNRFWDLLDGVPGLRAHRPPTDSNSTMGGWYSARGLYRADELGGLPCAKFCEAVSAEGLGCAPGANFPLHLHPMFHTADVFRMGEPTMVSFGQRDVRQGEGTLPVSESIGEIAYSIPWFKHDRPELIEQYAAAYRKVAEHADELLKVSGDE